MRPQRTVYLDYSATTPVDPRVFDAMLPYFNDVFGNPSSAHKFGREAESAIEQARETIAAIFNCQPNEVIFTSGGSESDNLAIRGAAWTAHQQGRGSHLITSPTEHPAVGNTISQLAEFMGFEKTILPVNQQGLINPGDFSEAISESTTLASIMYANNEIGTVQSLAELGRIARDHDVLLHSDAVQAAGQLSLDVQALKVNMLSISAHKFYGPKGVGALYVRDDIDLIPSQSGGSHERGRRAGTHNTAFIIGMAKALELAYDEQEYRMTKLTKLRTMLIGELLSRVPQAILTGHPEQRLPSHTSFILDGIDANQLLMHMDMKGVAGSSGSACKTGNPEPSDILLALGYDQKSALSGLRLTLSHHTSEDELAYAIDVIVDSVKALSNLKQALSS